MRFVSVVCAGLVLRCVFSSSLSCGGSTTSSGSQPSVDGSGTTSSSGSLGASSGSTGSGSSGGSSSGGSSSGSSTSSSGSAPTDASVEFDAPPAPAGLAGFAFVVNGVEQTPLSCPAESWEYPPPAAQVRTSAADGGPADGSPTGPTLPDTLCGTSLPPQPPCSGLSVFLVNTGRYPVAYTAQTTWSGWTPPGVPFGNPNELSGVMNPGASVDITSVYVGGLVAVLGSSRPFVDPDAGKYVADGTTVPWPAGVAGSGGATQMYVAEIEIEDSCRSPAVYWP
jgi:hypothetical protein